MRESKSTEAQKRAWSKYQKEKCVSVFLKLNKETDKDIIEFLSWQSNKQGLIKSLIRAEKKRIDEITRAGDDD